MIIGLKLEQSKQADFYQKVTYIMKQVGLVYYVMRLTCIKKQPVSWNRLVPNLLRHINDLYKKNDMYHETGKV